VRGDTDALSVSANLEGILEELKRAERQKRSSASGGKRVCEVADCGTRLAAYNKTARCSIHTAPTRAAWSR
jgi:hypothetical protein